jgi:hypothetical protein
MEHGFQIDCFVDTEVIVNIQPTRVEECHGYHYFDDSSYEVEIQKVYIEVAGKRIDITDRLTTEELRAIEDTLEPNIDL